MGVCMNVCMCDCMYVCMYICQTGVAEGDIIKGIVVSNPAMNIIPILNQKQFITELKKASRPITIQFISSADDESDESDDDINTDTNTNTHTNTHIHTKEKHEKIVQFKEGACDLSNTKAYKE